MKTKLTLLVVAACLAFAPATFAQYTQPNNSMLYLPNVNLTTLSQNNFSGVVGGIFYTPYYYNVNVNYLGYADPTGASLVDSHTVTLWDNNGNVVASAVVSSGNAAPLYDGYRWVQLPSTVTLTYQNYYEIGATVTGGVDSWGDLINNTATDNGNNGQITWNVVNGSWSGDPNSPFVQAGGGYEFSRDGQYGATALPGSQTTVQDSIYPAPNAAYNLPLVPEPASLSIAGVGAALLFGLVLKRKALAS
jgi:hypothetical protein